MDHNPFADKMNPYEAPIIRAELVDRPSPSPSPRPSPRRNWPPFFAILWLIGGPFLCLWLFRFCRHELQLFTIEDDAVFALFYAVTGTLWLIAMARVVIWLFRSLVT